MIELAENGKIRILEHPEFDCPQWKQIPEWDDYFVHPKGFIKSVKHSINTRSRSKTTKSTILSMFTVKKYLAVNFIKTVEGKEYRKSVRVHRLVAESFIPKEPGKFHVNHIDGNTINSDVNNLEWCTPSENELHSYRTLNKVNPGIAKRKIPISEIEEIKKRINNGISQKIIAQEYGVDQSVISKIVNEKIYTKHLN